MAQQVDLESEAADAESQAKVLAKDPFVGNVSKLIPLPVDHKGPPMRGHLLFDACFEGGEPKPIARCHGNCEMNLCIMCVCTCTQVTWVVWTI